MFYFRQPFGNVLFLDALIFYFEASEHTGSRKQPKEPIIRLRIDYMGFETFSINR